MRALTPILAFASAFCVIDPVENTTYSFLQAGRINRVPSLWGDDANGGATFILKNNPVVNGSAGVDVFLLVHYPGMSD